VQVVEAYGSLLAELGEQEQAILVLQKVVSLSPESGHEKYLYLGQLVEGDEGLAYTRKGVQLLQNQLNEAIASCSTRSEDTKLMPGINESEAGHSSEPTVTKREMWKGDAGVDEDMEGINMEHEEDLDEVQMLREGLCSALCSLAEMVMGRSESLEGRSECEEVEGLLDRARTACCSSPEPDQVLASLRYEQGRPEEALEALRRSMKLWFRKQEEVDEDMEFGDEVVEGKRGRKSSCGEMDHDRDREAEGVPLAEPSYEFRFECAKLLLELDDSTEVAIQVSCIQTSITMCPRRSQVHCQYVLHVLFPLSFSSTLTLHDTIGSGRSGGRG
jgi:kinesin family protein 5